MYTGRAGTAGMGRPLISRGKDAAIVPVAVIDEIVSVISFFIVM